MSQLFWNKDLGSYFLIPLDGENITCHDCKAVIEQERRCFIHRSFSKKRYIRSILCNSCVKKHKLRIYDEFINAEVTLIPPKGSSIVPEYRPGLKNAGPTTTFDIREIEKKGGETVDNCKVAHDPNRNIMDGALEHKEKVLGAIEKLDSKASLNDVENILKQKPAIEDKGKRPLIGNKNA